MKEELSVPSGDQDVFKRTLTKSCHIQKKKKKKDLSFNKFEII